MLLGQIYVAGNNKTYIRYSHKGSEAALKQKNVSFDGGLRQERNLAKRIATGQFVLVGVLATLRQATVNFVTSY